jgi:hypothetical protein
MTGGGGSTTDQCDHTQLHDAACSGGARPEGSAVAGDSQDVQDASPWLRACRGVAAWGGRAQPRALLDGQVRFCRYRFSPTGELGYSGIRGSEF